MSDIEPEHSLLVEPGRTLDGAATPLHTCGDCTLIAHREHDQPNDNDAAAAKEQEEDAVILHLVVGAVPIDEPAEEEPEEGDDREKLQHEDHDGHLVNQHEE